MLLAPAGVGGHAEIAHDPHAAGVTQTDQPGGEVVAQTWLGRDFSAFIPSIAVAGNGEGLDDVRAEPRIPGDVLLRVGIRPKPRRRETIGPARSPVEVDAECADWLPRQEGRTARVQEQDCGAQESTADQPGARRMASPCRTV